ATEHKAAAIRKLSNESAKTSNSSGGVERVPAPSNNEPPAKPKKASPVKYREPLLDYGDTPPSKSRDESKTIDKDQEPKKQPEKTDKDPSNPSNTSGKQSSSREREGQKEKEGA
ncbi:hypothetical protein PMAYCL1PPCAC_03432, partial [Pristionchus mayeri]